MVRLFFSHRGGLGLDDAGELLRTRGVLVLGGHDGAVL